MIKLTESPIKFLEKEHTYYLGGKQLQGITGTLIAKAFPNTYSNIPESILMKAAERGSIIHQTFELFNTVFGADINQWVGERTQELIDLNNMLLSYGLHHVASEYLVTDGEHFASAIDGVYADADDKVYLVDYKTTSELHYDNVSLQLSIYKKWFEKMNPDLRVHKLVCMWFKNGKSKFQPLPIVADEKIDDLIKAYLDGDEGYKYEVEVPEAFSSLEQEYSLLTARIDTLSMRRDEVKREMMQIMEKECAKSINTCMGTYTFIPETTKKTFDVKAFKEANPENYDKYIKYSSTKSSLKITLKK